MKSGYLLVLVVVILYALATDVQGLVIRDVKSDLVAKGNELLKNAEDAIKALEAQHKTVEVTLFKSEEAAIQKLVKELQEATDAAKITVIEHDLNVVASKLEFELQKLAHPGPDQPSQQDHLKPLLLTRAKALLTQTESTIKKLKAEKNDHEISLLEQDEASIKKLVKDLETAKPDSDLAQIERQLQDAELKLSIELRKISRLPQADPLKEYLLKRATALEKQVGDAIGSLKAAGKVEEVKAIEKDEALVKKLLSDLKVTKAGDNLSKIEQDLQSAEARLALELKKINDVKPSIKEQLLTRAKTIEKQAEDAIKSLKAANKSTEAGTIQKEQDNIKQLVKELEDTAKTDADLKKIETDLTLAESKLANELSKIHAVARRDVKSDLIANGTALLKQADDAIKKLEKEQKTQEIAVVKKEEAEIQKLVTELQAATDAAKITAIEHDLKVAESRLRYELRKIETPVAHPDQKQILLSRAQTLEKQAEQQVLKLKASKQDADVAILEKQEADVKKLVKDLEAAKTPADITRIESELQTAEYRLSYQIRKILDSQFKEEAKKKILLQQAGLIEKYAEETIKALKADKKDADAAALEKEEALIKKLVADLGTAKTEAELHKIENDLAAAEDNLYNHAKALRAQSDPLKEQLLKKAADLEKQAVEAIQKLKVAQKDTEAAPIEKDEALVKKLVQDLLSAKTDADIKKIEHDLNEAEARLLAEITKAMPHF